MEISEAYEIMTLGRNASLDEVKKSYVEFVKDYDPNNVDRENFNRVTYAFQTLMTHVGSVNQSGRKVRINSLTFKLGEVIPQTR